MSYQYYILLYFQVSKKKSTSKFGRVGKIHAFTKCSIAKKKVHANPGKERAKNTRHERFFFYPQQKHHLRYE